MSSSLNTFQVHIPVLPGDLIGLNTPLGLPNTACDHPQPGDADFLHPGDLADGTSGAFSADPDYRLNLTAEVGVAPTGQQAAALKKCKKKHKRNHNAKQFRKCKKKAKKLPV